MLMICVVFFFGSVCLSGGVVHQSLSFECQMGLEPSAGYYSLSVQFHNYRLPRATDCSVYCLTSDLCHAYYVFANGSTATAFASQDTYNCWIIPSNNLQEVRGNLLQVSKTTSGSICTKQTSSPTINSVSNLRPTLSTAALQLTDSNFSSVPDIWTESISSENDLANETTTNIPAATLTFAPINSPSFTNSTSGTTQTSPSTASESSPTTSAKSSTETTKTSTQISSSSPTSTTSNAATSPSTVPTTKTTKAVETTTESSPTSTTITTTTKTTKTTETTTKTTPKSTSATTKSSTGTSTTTRPSQPGSMSNNISSLSPNSNLNNSTSNTNNIPLPSSTSTGPINPSTSTGPASDGSRGKSFDIDNFKKMENETTWSDAFNQCSLQNNFELVVVDTIEKMNFIANQVTTLYDTNCYWIDAQLLNDDSQWKTRDGTLLNSSLINAYLSSIPYEYPAVLCTEVVNELNNPSTVNWAVKSPTTETNGYICEKE